MVAPAELGSRFAREVHERSPGTPVLLVAATGERHDELAAELRVTPGISPRTRCVPPGREVLGELVAEAVDRSRREARHRAAVRGVRAELAVLADATPETLSEYLGQLFDHAPIGIVLTDAEGRVQAANPGARRVLGRRGHLSSGSPFTDCFGAARDRAADLLAEGLSGDGVAVDTLVRVDGGVEQHLEVTVAAVGPSGGPPGRAPGAVVLIRDETARVVALRRAEEERRAARAAAERSATLAATLQSSLLPPSLPEPPGVALAAWFRPAGDGSEVGGDFYDVFEPGGGGWLAVVGDVCGKGVAAARLTALTRYTLRAVAPRTGSCAADLAALNSALCRNAAEGSDRPERRFVTAAVVRLAVDGDALVVEVGTAGHPPPVIVRADGTVGLPDCRGPLLGIWDDVSFRTDRLRLGAGDVLVLHTDGVTEARRGAELLGEDRLHDVVAAVAGQGPGAAVGAVRHAVMGFQAGHTSDDVAVLALGPAAPAGP